MFNSTILQVVNDRCTPARMAAAGVPLDLARWYHTKARHLTRFTAQEADQVLRIRFKVTSAKV